ncbi:MULTISPECIES: hypothetical protein [Citrobacter]|uniref:hypothetical protein n=1 Tax=Citrobacter TaxID=544 RepID=UPI0012499B26|nr:MULTISPECIES: hypothetical protein [unclassified Citrobacter]MBC6504325.1 hypothetical protein [Citrobacter freundii]MBC6509050.1 hypothetical protein [Citrobacter freundii]MBP8544593.1 hypothetical protein [Citrobacter sp. On2M]MBW5271510.1 hypothetical protein [Citrobacter sp. On28M]MDG5478212.1 hypothetical protein [Citrobacter freundii]
MLKFVLVILSGMFYTATASATDRFEFFDYCSVSMVNMVASSNQPLMIAEHVGAKDLRIEAEEDDESNVMLQLFDRRKKSTPDTPGAGHLGWVTYHPAKNILTDINDEQLQFDPQKGKHFQQCLTRMRECQDLNQKLKLDATIDFPRYALTGKSRAWFYAAPVAQCRSESIFIVPGDIVSRTGFSIARDEETQKFYESVRGNDSHGYLLAGYGGYVGWIEANHLEAVDLVCNDARDKSGLKNPAPEEFVERKVAQTQPRLYFYDAPDKACLREDNSFIIADDKVQMVNRSAYAGFSFVRYTHPVTHKVTEGWVLASGLK